MSDSIANYYAHTRDNAFLLNENDLEIVPDGPKIVLAFMASLEVGVSHDIFVDWVANSRNLVLFIERGQSLSVVTHTAIAISLPAIQNSVVYSLLSSVGVEVEIYHKWLGIKLKNATNINGAGLTLQWLKYTANNMVTEIESIDIRNTIDDAICRSFSSNSLYHVTKSMLVSNHTNIDEVSQEELLSMIYDILVACLTKLPQVIAMKCHTNMKVKKESKCCIPTSRSDFTDN
ncbi:brefeldin A-inhibited guanine nucleotide-exchange protein 5 [Tanacetum coccineum]